MSDFELYDYVVCTIGDFYGEVLQVVGFTTNRLGLPLVKVWWMKRGEELVFYPDELVLQEDFLYSKDD